MGAQGLAWSFWVNLVLLRVLIMVLHEWLRPPKSQDFQDSQIVVLLLALTFHGVIFIWQAVGVIRASEASIRANGFMAPVWGAQLALILAFFWVLAYALDAWQMTLPAMEELRIQTELEAERAAKYSIEPTTDERSLIISGSLELGITAELKRQLMAYPHLEQIILASLGGNIYEARGLSNTIRQNGLNTLVLTECSSACTAVFIGGTKRLLGPDGRLGFHQYRIDADYAVLNASPLLEQERDRKTFLQSGVSDWFLEEIFESSPAEMWYPERDKLFEARVITEFQVGG